MQEERRNFARLALHAKAFLHWHNQDIEAEVGNVSLKGAFIMADRQMRVDDVVAFSIDSTPTCDLKAKIVRVTDQGMGLLFEKTLLD